MQGERRKILDCMYANNKNKQHSLYVAQNDTQTKFVCESVCRKKICNTKTVSINFILSAVMKIHKLSHFSHMAAAILSIYSIQCT